ncbi:hypothetical protein Q8A73_007394 [Channa argus]|nr:hypothetical protein Q8A73_007394 [Channa argus]
MDTVDMQHTEERNQRTGAVVDVLSVLECQKRTGVTLFLIYMDTNRGRGSIPPQLHYNSPSLLVLSAVFKINKQRLECAETLLLSAAVSSHVSASAVRLSAASAVTAASHYHGLMPAKVLMEAV